MVKNTETYPLDKVLMCAACEIAVNGYMSYDDVKSKGGHTTKNMVKHMLQGSDFGKEHQAKLIEAAEANGVDLFGATFKVAVLDVIAWAKKINPSVTNYDATIWNIANRHPMTVTVSEFGQVASMLMTYQRHLAARQQIYFGTVGHTEEVDITITNIKTGFGQYGAWWNIKAVTDTQTLINWFSNKSPDYEVDDKLTVRGTVNDHTEFNGDKWTKLSRVKVLKGYGSKV